MTADDFQHYVKEAMPAWYDIQMTISGTDKAMASIVLTSAAGRVGEQVRADIENYEMADDNGKQIQAALEQAMGDTVFALTALCTIYGLSLTGIMRDTAYRITEEMDDEDAE